MGRGKTKKQALGSSSIHKECLDVQSEGDCIYLLSSSRMIKQDIHMAKDHLSCRSCTV